MRLSGQAILTKRRSHRGQSIWSHGVVSEGGVKTLLAQVENGVKTKVGLVD